MQSLTKNISHGKRSGVTLGFTLIELLVVISIISLLSTVVLTSLQAARKSGLNSKYTQELRSLGTALAIYKLDHGEYPNCYASSPCVMNDLYGNGYFDTVLTPLITEGIIPSIPHYPGWVPGVGSNTA